MVQFIWGVCWWGNLLREDTHYGGCVLVWVCCVKTRTMAGVWYRCHGACPHAPQREFPIFGIWNFCIWNFTLS
jgi:hypothetical protein